MAVSLALGTLLAPVMLLVTPLASATLAATRDWLDWAPSAQAASSAPASAAPARPCAGPPFIRM